MRRLRLAIGRIRDILAPRRLERELEDEVSFHVAMEAEQHRQRGVDTGDAWERAHQDFGGVVRYKEQVREAHGLGGASRLDAFVSELRFAYRTLRHSPGFCAAVVLTLALGIGANATMFGIVDRLLLRSPALVKDPARVVTAAIAMHDEDGDWTQRVLSYPIYRDLREAKGLDGVAAFQSTRFTLGNGATARQVRGALVSSVYFDLLGVRPEAGRFFEAGDDALPSGLPVAVVSDEFWKTQLGGARDVLGSQLSVAGKRFTVVGVAPPGFANHDRSPVDLWIPMTAGRSTTAGDTSWTTGRQSYWIRVIARLSDGVDRRVAAEQATAALQRNDPALAGAKKWRVEFTSVVPREALANSEAARATRLVALVSIVVLLIACANVANLQLVRAIRRRREIAVRVALGLGRGRLALQLVLESLLLAVAGGAAALMVVYWGGALLTRTLLADLPLPGSAVSGRVLAFTAAVASGAGLLTGMVPLLEAGRASFGNALKQGSRGAGTRRGRTRAALLLIQAALSVTLLVGAGVFVKSLVKVSAIPLGLDASHVLVGTLETTGSTVAGEVKQRMYERLLERARRSPEVESAALGVALPFSTSFSERVRLPGGVRPPTTKDGGPYYNAVTPDFFATMGTRLLRGRAFTTADAAGAERVAVVNENVARLWWPGEDPLGKCILIGDDGAPCTTVVGVVENVHRQAILEDEVVQYFVPLAQGPEFPQALFLRTRRDPVTAREPLRRELQSAGADLPYLNLGALGDAIDRETRSWRLGATMFGAFGALALVLAGIGLFSVLAYDVAQRTHEIGVRVALGARVANVLRMVVASAMRLVLLGAAIGLALTMVGGRFVEPLLYQTSPYDLPVVMVVLLLVIGVGVAASVVPARRAARVDPATALRAD